jgi:hypothetical protein
MNIPRRNSVMGFVLNVPGSYIRICTRMNRTIPRVDPGVLPVRQAARIISFSLA